MHGRSLLTITRIHGTDTRYSASRRRIEADRSALHSSQRGNHVLDVDKKSKSPIKLLNPLEHVGASSQLPNQLTNRSALHYVDLSTGRSKDDRELVNRRRS